MKEEDITISDLLAQENLRVLSDGTIIRLDIKDDAENEEKCSD